MPKSTSVYVCQQCGYKSPQYLGKCPQCDSWNSMVEQVEESQKPRAGTGRPLDGKAEIVDLSKIQKTDYKRLDTGFEEFNRVLGGGSPRGEAGVVLGSVVLVSGDPGIGKSTLLTQLALNVNHESGIMNNGKKENHDSLFNIHNSNVLYVAGEESAQQIKIRVDRIKPNFPLSVLSEVDVDLIIEAIERTKPALVIVDSIQTMETQDLESVAGSVGQVRECTHRLQRIAKDLHIPIFLVGHVTKEGNLAGPKTLEHVVDVVLSLEGDSASPFRILRSTKNRFGPADEVGIFEMSENGMNEVTNPSKLFLEQKIEAPGSVVVATMSGYRPILVEIQALVTRSFLPMPRRVGSGIDNNRLQLLVAVLMKRLGLSLFDKDIFVNVTGGLRVYEPAVDLGICLSIISSLTDKKVVSKTMVLGEIGLLGEIREVRGKEKRMAEAKKLGFTNIISPTNAKNLSQAVKLAF